MPSLREISSQTFPAVSLNAAGLRSLRQSSAADPNVVAHVLSSSHRSTTTTGTLPSPSSRGKFDDSLCRSTRSHDERIAAAVRSSPRNNHQTKLASSTSSSSKGSAGAAGTGGDDEECPPLFARLYTQRPAPPQVQAPSRDVAEASLRRDYANRHQGSTIRSQWATPEEAASHFHDEAKAREVQRAQKLEARRNQEYQQSCKQVGTDRGKNEDEDAQQPRDVEDVVRHLTSDSLAAKARDHEMLTRKYVNDVQTQNQKFIATLPGSARSKALLKSKQTR